MSDLPLAKEVELLDNPEWQEGIASSLRVAIRWAADRKDCAGLLVMLSDQPHLSTHHIDALIHQFEIEQCERCIGSAYEGIVGVPAILPRTLFAEAAMLRGDRGARALLNAHGVVAVPWQAGAVDLDTPRDVADLKTAQTR